MFGTRTALNKYLVSAEHRRLTVLCPWCNGKDRTFTKISDLEVHVRSRHHTINLPKDRFTRSNGFYFGVYPHDYAKVVEAITDYDSEAAYDVRKAVRSWAEGFQDKKERIDKWNAGWKEGVRIAADRARAKSRERSEARSVDQAKTNRSSVGEDDADRRVADRRELKRKTGLDKAERGLKLARVDEDSALNDGLDAYEDDIEIGDCEGDGENARRDGRQAKECGVGARTRHEERQSEEREKGGNYRRVEVNERRHEQGEGEDWLRNRRQRVEGRIVERSQEGQCDRGKELQGDKRQEERENRQREEHENGNKDIDLERNAGGHAKLKEGLPDNDFRGCKGGSPDDNDAASTITSSSSTSSSSDDSVSSKDGEDADGIRARAIRMLKRGAMPACPPAKRDWTSFSQKLEIDCDGQVISWPPANWKQLKPDQRLMAHEYAALFLERTRTKVSDFPRISRRSLLDKYAFLALEGQGKPQEEDGETEKLEAKIRQYNSSYLKGLAKGEISSSRVAWSILRTIEKSDRWEDTDVFTDKLDAGGVKIRI